MTEPKLTEAQRRALLDALYSHANMPDLVASMIADADQTARAQGWDEGYHRGVAEALSSRPPTRNPYRSTP